MKFITVAISLLSLSFTYGLNSPISHLKSNWYRHVIKPATVSIAALSIFIPFAPIIQPSHAIFEDPTASLNLEAPKNGFIPRLADVGVGQFLVKDGKQLLRLALPSTNKFKFPAQAQASNDPARKIQENLELVKVRLEQVGNKNKPAWSGALSDLTEIQSIISKRSTSLLAPDDSANPTISTEIFENKFKPSLLQLLAAVKAEDIIATLVAQESAASLFSDFQLSRLPPTLPYLPPSEYPYPPYPIPSTSSSTPYRSVVNIIIKKKTGNFVFPDLSKGVELGVKVAVDGYTHPITAGRYGGMGVWGVGGRGR